MAIIQTVTDKYHFWTWLQNNDNYSKNFTLDGALALQEYLEECSEETGETVEFDPIAWCCEYSEYESYEEAYKDYGDGTITDPEEIKQFIDERTMTYEFDNEFGTNIIIQNF